MTNIYYTIKNLETGKLEKWTMAQILIEINRDRSEEFTPYDLTDWLEGWYDWCEGRYYQLYSIKNEEQPK